MLIHPWIPFWACIFCEVLLLWTMIEGPNASDQIASVCIPFILSGSPIKNMPRMRNTKCYGMQAITIEGQNAFAPTLCFTLVLCYRWSRHGWPNCVLCIPFILSGSPNESWLHTCDECVITIWRLWLRAPLVARNCGCFLPILPLFL